MFINNLGLRFTPICLQYYALRSLNSLYLLHYQQRMAQLSRYSKVERSIFMRNCFVIVVCFLIWNQGFNTPFVKSHSEADKARFVSENGADTSDCNNRFRPCQSISYAVTRANKGDKILVAEGSYNLSSSESIVYIIADTHPVLGGFNVTDNYQSQSPDKFVTTLIGVPQEYAQQVHEKGFHVISDTKGSGPINVSKVSEGVASIALMQNSQPASACVNNSAAGFSCSNLSLLGRLPLSDLPTSSSTANDIWGHVDLNDMREYAIIGLQRGIAVLDVSDPELPTVVGSISGQSTTWRDIKVLQYYDETTKRFKAYAYSGGDNISEGLSVVDLSMLPNSISLVRRNLIDAQSHNVYVSNVNYTTNSALNGQAPLLHVTGSNNFGGAWRTYTLSTPSAPETAYRNSSAQRSNYTHDASSLLINDSRAQTDCRLDSGASCNVILDFNESEVRLWEHNNPEEATQLSQFTYPNLDYVHSGWWSEDKQYIFVHDELDERSFALNTTLNVFDISDLRSPQLVETWRGPTQATDHNGFVKGNKYYMSNYERGVTILDISDPTALSEIAYFDTFGASNNASFNGVWGVYPFLPSGHILVSDIRGGLYILKDETLSANDDAAGFLQTQLSVNEGSTLRVEVFKQGQGDLSVDYQVLHASIEREDISDVSGTLEWSANDNQSQFIEIDIIADSQDEYDELAIVVLNNPKNGDIVNAKSHAFITIEGNLANTGQLSFDEAEINVLETQNVASLAVNRLGGNEQAISATVSLLNGSATNTEDFAFSNGQSTIILQWEEGDSASQNVDINIVNDAQLEGSENFVATLATLPPSALGDISQINVTIKDDESNTAPSVNAGADIQVNTRQTVSLNGTSAQDAESDFSVSWMQSAGPVVNLNNASSLNPTFVAPTSASTLTFIITVTDEFGLTATDAINVSIVAPLVPPSNTSSGSGGSVGIAVLVLLLLFLCSRNKLLLQVSRQP
jgi:choice-of-anchor B domain-containing protein